MARQNINYGTNPNDGTGDTLRVAMDKVNDNFVELYGESSTETNLTFGVNAISVDNINGSLALNVNGTGTVQINQGLLVNADAESSNSIFYAADGTEEIKVDALNKRIGINKSTPTSTLDVVGTGAFTGNVNIGASLTVGSNGNDRLTINSSIFGNLIPGTSYSLGSSSNPWNQTHITTANLTTVNSTTITTSSLTATTGITGNITGNLITSSDIRILNGAFVSRVNTATLSANRQVNFPNRNGTIVVTTTSGRMAGPTSAPPSSSVGAAGDTAGDIAFSNSHIYYCTANFDGSTVIWKRAELDSW
jgi:hypothetical protein